MEPPPLVLLVGLALLGAAGRLRDGSGWGEGCRWKGRREGKRSGLRWVERKGGGGRVGGFSRPSAGPGGAAEPP